MVFIRSILTCVLLFHAFSVRGFLLNSNTSNHLLSSVHTTGYDANTIIYLFKKIDDLQLQIHQQSKTLEAQNKTMEAQSKTLEAQKNVIQELLNITKQEPSAVSLSNDLSILQMYVRGIIDEHHRLSNVFNATNVLALRVNSMAGSVRLITSSLTDQGNRMNTMDGEFQQQINSLNKSLISAVNRVLQDEKDIFNNCSSVSSFLSRLETNMSDINDRIHSLESKVIFDDVDCFDILRRNPYIKGQDGVYTIYPNIIRNKTVYCDMTTEGGGWTVIQNRIDGSTDFYRTWKEYKEGFGNSSHNYWIGNDVIHQLTKDENHVLRVELQRFSGEKGYAEYSTFIVGDEQSKYKLTVAGYKGNIGDKLKYHNGMKFSTHDDNDGGGSSCAQHYHGAWWYYACYDSNLNGKYMGPHVIDNISMNWKWAADGESLKISRMMIHDVDCFDILRRNPYVKCQDGVYTIYPDRIRNLTVYCDMTTTGGGWTVIQNRIDGATDFYRTWKEYKEGFGNSSHNYWIGNDVIHLLTKDKNQVLRVELQTFSGAKGYAEYSTFIVGDEQSKYKLTVSGYKGNIGDKLNNHNGSKFSTPDQDNDGSSGPNCAHEYHGAWWYYNCYDSNLNGKYMGPNVDNVMSMNWHWPIGAESLNTSRMMIRST
uniref:Angiopoietin-2-like n=1 Tax=Crassostrea virginica TaxID=6565 RepID=A0A8B8AQ49_CRAVI|nr:angiopoietin-2-like [Crassostrea virginica]